MAVSPSKTSGSRRKEIRKQIVKILRGRTDARDNIRVNPGEASWQENLPQINVYFKGEGIDSELAQAPRLLRRVINFEIEIIADDNNWEDLSDKLDDMAEQVEVLLSIDDSLDCLADDIILDAIDIDTEGVSTKPVGSVRLSYRILYSEFSPRDIRDQGNFPDLKTIDATYDVTPEDADKPKDTINF